MRRVDLSAAPALPVPALRESWHPAPPHICVGGVIFGQRAAPVKMAANFLGGVLHVRGPKLVGQTKISVQHHGVQPLPGLARRSVTLAFNQNVLCIIKHGLLVASQISPDQPREYLQARIGYRPSRTYAPGYSIGPFQSPVGPLARVPALGSPTGPGQS